MIYPDEFELKVGFDRIRSRIVDLCLSQQGRERAASLSFSTSSDVIEREIGRTDEFQRILELDQEFPLHH